MTKTYLTDEEDDSVLSIFRPRRLGGQPMRNVLRRRECSTLEVGESLWEVIEALCLPRSRMGDPETEELWPCSSSIERVSNKPMTDFRLWEGGLRGEPGDSLLGSMVGNAMHGFMQVQTSQRETKHLDLNMKCIHVYLSRRV